MTADSAGPLLRSFRRGTAFSKFLRRKGPEVREAATARWQVRPRLRGDRCQERELTVSGALQRGHRPADCLAMCSILFHLLVPGGKWQTEMRSPVCSAS